MELCSFVRFNSLQDLIDFEKAVLDGTDIFSGQYTIDVLDQFTHEYTYQPDPDNPFIPGTYFLWYRDGYDRGYKSDMTVLVRMPDSVPDAADLLKKITDLKTERDALSTKVDILRRSFYDSSVKSSDLPDLSDDWEERLQSLDKQMEALGFFY